MHEVFPSSLIVNGVQYNKAGCGTIPESRVYIAPATGHILKAQICEVVQTEPCFALCRILESGMQWFSDPTTIKIEAGSCTAFSGLIPGSYVLAAGITQTTGGLLRAAYAEAIHVENSGVRGFRRGCFSVWNEE